MMNWQEVARLLLGAVYVYLGMVLAKHWCVCVKGLLPIWTAIVENRLLVERKGVYISSNVVQKKLYDQFSPVFFI